MYHVFMECSRVLNFWRMVEDFLKKLDSSTALNQEHMIFGIPDLRRNMSIVVNMLIESAQRCNWHARMDFEDKDKNVDLWKSLRTRLLALLNRTRSFLPKNRYHLLFVDSGWREIVTGM